MAKKNYYENTNGIDHVGLQSTQRMFQNLNEATGKDVLKDFNKVVNMPAFQKQLLESVCNMQNLDESTNSVIADDLKARSIMMENSLNEILTEATGMASGGIHPITVSTFGILRKSYAACNMFRAVKTLTANIPAFEILERKPYIEYQDKTIQYFPEAFAAGNNFLPNLNKTITSILNIGDSNKNLLTGAGLDENHMLSLDIKMTSYTAVKADGTTALDPALCKFSKGTNRRMDRRTGLFTTVVEFGFDASDKQQAVISAKIDHEHGTLEFLSSSNPRVKTVTFTSRASHETHLTPSTVKWKIDTTQVSIAEGEHIQFTLSKEFEDDQNKFFSIDSVSTASMDMGMVIERIEDNKIIEKIEELSSVDNATIRTVFDCTPENYYSLGKENWMKTMFHPFMEKVCIGLKEKANMEDCHFRVVGNPFDVRIPAEASYIYKRNSEFNGECILDYDFAVSTNAQTIFYLSTYRVPAGLVYVNLIPNSIENNLATVNHYRYATYISNKYRDPNNPALPTLMITNRTETREYFPIEAVIKITNNTLPAWT